MLKYRLRIKIERYKALSYKIRINTMGEALENFVKDAFEFKKIDPLGITDLRVRGMWGIKHPSKVFDYTTERQSKPYIKALMLKSQFELFDVETRNQILKKCRVKDIKI